VNYESYSVDQLGAAAAELNDQVDALVGTLAGIECTATADGITATVNLEGRLTHLTLTPEAVSRSPRTLAAQILQLTQQAAATALTEALAALPPLTPSLHALLTAHAPADDARTRPEAPASPTAAPGLPDDPEDFSRIPTWSLPR
jgi:hypothetical protein